MKHSGNHRCGILAVAATLVLASVDAAEGVKPLRDFPQADRIWMGMEEGSIRPSAYLQQRSTVEGFLLLQAVDGQELKAGEQWGVLDPEQLAIETKALEMDERNLEQQRRKLKMDAMEAESQMTLELFEMMDNKAALVEAGDNAQLSAAMRRQAREAAAKLDKQIALRKQMLTPESLEKELQAALDGAELAVTRKRKQIDVLRRNSILKAPFDSTLRLSNDIKEAIEQGKGSKAWVESNQLIGTLKDDSRYEITVAAAGPLMASIPHDDLEIFLQEGRTGRLIKGDYQRTEEIDTGVEIRTHYIFVVPKSAMLDAAGCIGQLNVVHVYRAFKRPYRVIFKKDIAFAAPEVLAASGWPGLVSHLWPGSQVVQVGPQTIAVQAKDED